MGMLPKKKESWGEWVVRKGLDKILAPAKLMKVTGKCYVCKFPLNLTTGQIAYYHKECRQYRNDAFGREQFLLEMHKEMRQSVITPSVEVK